MSEPADSLQTESNRRGRDEQSWLSRVGSDWWATILGLAITALAVAGALPRIPW